ncbi:MAG: bifunctional riboflavin kinase/FAD synthetase [Lachnospiraceae bacterium]|nr:bifunctional riboflavin kinase/FAD synthetase [Lachnospiraceae bacterium]
MEIIRDTKFQLNKDTAVTIGKFDGIHRGHRELLDRVLFRKDEGLSPTVFTFDKSPQELFSGRKLSSLTTMEEKIRIFEHLGVENLVIYPLTEESASISPEDYITNILCKQMRMKYIVAGDDISFGHMGRGNAELLRSMSKIKDKERYKLEIIKKITIDGEEVSSSLIRSVVSEGDMEKASKLIGVPYAVSGIVAHGRRLGREMGFPTVNLIVSEDKLMPPFGVYFTEVSVNGKHYNGITNIGTKPTVTDDNTVFAETNILDFDSDIYGEQITVKLLKFHRREVKFSSVEELKQQIDTDIYSGKEYFK